MLAVRGWLSAYKGEWFRPDVIAGLTLATYLLPAGIGDASLAGLPPEAGLYACLFSGLVFWIFCSSKHTVITVTSALSLLIGASVADLSGGDPARHAALAACAALIMAGIAIIAWLVRAGNAIAFVSETVLVGFKSGLAFYLASTQLPKLFGFKGTHGDFWERSGYFLSHLDETRAASLIIGAIALAVLVAGKLWLKNRPVAFFVVVAGIVAVPLLNLSARGVSLLGAVPQGLPSLGLPVVSRTDLNNLLPVALACFVLGAVETSAIGRMFGAKHGYRLDANQEILALGAANLLSALGRGFPVSGGMSQSLVNESAGARTPLSGLVAALVTLAVALFASGLLRDLPQPVLAAVVLAAVMGLINVTALRHLWHFSRAEFLVAMAAFFGVLGSGPVNGALLGAGISIVMLLRQSSRPRVVALGRVPGTTYFVDRARHPDTVVMPGAVVIRCESSLLYYNADYVRDRLLELVDERQDRVQLVVFFLGLVPRIDLAGAELLMDLHRTFQARGIAFRLADAHGEVREALRRVGFHGVYGPLESAESVDDVLTAWQSQTLAAR
jgi:high affinity sulfate transporter 1